MTSQQTDMQTEDTTSDMLATAIDKLPPPAMHTRADSPSSVAPPAYQDLMKEVDSSDRYQMQLPPTPRPPPPPVQVPAMSAPQPSYYYDHPPPPHTEQQQQQHYFAIPPPPPPTMPVSRAPLFSVETLSNKKLWIIAAIVFATVAYAIPRLQITLPSLVNPATGTLSTPALGGVALLIGFVITASDRFIV